MERNDITLPTVTNVNTNPKPEMNTNITLNKAFRAILTADRSVANVTCPHCTTPEKAKITPFTTLS
jgi:hypothetical protein